MKLLILTAIIAAVTCSPLTQNENWPWQVGKEYLYDVDTYTWTNYDRSDSNGNAFKAQFIVSVVAPGHLEARLSEPSYAQFQTEKITYSILPTDLKYQPIEFTDQSFSIFLEGGRVKSFSVPLTLPVAHENLLKGLISAIQVDLSTFGHVDNFPNSYDKESFQGLFKKTETDVTGDCETLYNVAPLSAEWRREIPKFASVEDPVEIIKTKNYGSCNKRVALFAGVPEGAVWNGIAYENEEKQFIKHNSEARLVVGKQGTIFKAEVLSSAYVSPLLFGKQKAEVYSYVKMFLSSVQETSGSASKKNKTRNVDSLLFTMTESMFIPKGNDQSIANAQKLLQDITPFLQNPNQLPKADFLTKFNILVRIISTLNTEQLTQLTRSTEIAKSSKNVAKTGMWTIYRDAVAQSGSYAAFEEIKSWILEKKVQGLEAAELITSIGASLRYHEKKIMSEFFDFAMKPVVMEQKYLNNSALLAATKYIRFGDENLFVVETVIPRLAEELKKAVENEDSSKAQVYIRVLGNLAHPEILKVYAPYLDGSIVVSKYLRIQIVASLKTLANMKNDQVRVVLYSILRNTAEAYEIRVAAALNIFMAFPTAEMMLVMAHMTNADPSMQVRSVLSNGIHFASGLKDPRFAELAKTAQSVKEYVAKEKFGYHTSSESIIDYFTSEDDIALFRELSFIGSMDSEVPVYHRAALRSRGTGWTEENQLTWTVSSLAKLLENVVDLFAEPNQSKVDFKYSAKKILENLKLKREFREPIEGAIFYENAAQQKLFTFNEADIKTIVTDMLDNMEKILEGVGVQYTKILNTKQIYVVFPMAAGVPFFFSYSEPLMYSLHGQIKFKVDTSAKDFAGSLDKDLDFTYARNMDGSVGFLDTLSDVYVAAGVVNKLQFYFPMKFTTVVQPGDIKLSFKLPEHDTTFVHFSVWPYTTLQKAGSLLPISEEPSTKYIKRAAVFKVNNARLDYITGVGNYINGYSGSSDFEDPKNFFGVSILQSLSTLMYQKDIAMTNFELKYVAKETKNKNVAFNLFYNTLYNQKESGEMGPASVFDDVTANSEGRRKEMIKRVASGIDLAEVRLVDISVIFDGEHKVEYVMTGALANSPVDNKAQAGIFVNAEEQFNAVFKITKPKIAPLNFEEALKNEIKVLYEADFKYGNNSNVHFNGVGERSSHYTEMLKNDPMAKQCLQETSTKNFYQMDCYKMIIKAHAPDYFYGNFTFKELSKEATYDIARFYGLLKRFYSWDEETNSMKTVEDGKLQMKAQAFYYDNYINYEFKTKYGLLRLKNIEGLPHYPYGMAIYTPISYWERAENVYSGYQYMPYCAVDGSKVWTFSGRSYDYSLTSSWHVVMADEGNVLTSELVMLARRPSENEEEVYISYKNDEGKYFELNIKPTAVDVKSNTEKTSEGALTTYWNDIEEVPLLQYYTLADGVQVFSINNGGIRLMYDSQRLIIFTDDHRQTTRGICGQSTTEIRDDYMTPYGLVDLPEYYGASFSLDDEFSDPKTVELKKEAKLKAYQPLIKYTNILRSDAEWSKVKNHSY